MEVKETRTTHGNALIIVFRVNGCKASTPAGPGDALCSLVCYRSQTTWPSSQVTSLPGGERNLRLAMTIKSTVGLAQSLTPKQPLLRASRFESRVLAACQGFGGGRGAAQPG